MKNRRICVKPYIEAALLVAVGLVLSTLTVARMPMGGSVTLGASIPVCLAGLRGGLRIGFLSGAAYGILSFLKSGIVIGIGPFICDYILAYVALGITGLFRKAPQNINATLLAFLLVGLAQTIRLFFHVLSGILFFSAADQSFLTALKFSLSYNLTFLVPDTLIGMGLFYKLIKKSKDILQQN
jgi:thiamine transporter